MAFFVGAGIISDDVVRKETRNGVLAVFRLETGAPNGRKLWIDVEAWGQLAGTIAHHATAGRGVLVSGRLTYKTWRDGESGKSRHRYVVTALDIDLLTEAVEPSSMPAALVAAGVIEDVYPDRPTKRGIVRAFRLASGRAGSKNGRLWIDIEHWQPNDETQIDLPERSSMTVTGHLGYRTRVRGTTDGLYVRSTSLQPCPTTVSARQQSPTTNSGPARDDMG